MNSNSWGREDLNPDQNPYGPGSTATYPYPQHQPPKNNGGLIATLVIGLIVLIGAGAAGLWYLDRDGGQAADTANVGGQDEPLDDTLVDGSGDGLGDGSGDGTADDDASLPPGLDYRGYADYPNAVCEAGDTWVYAAEGGGSAVVVCFDERGGDLYMRGDFDIGPTAGDVDMDGWVDVAEGIYTVEVSGGLIEFYGPEVWFTDGEDIVTLGPFDSFWYDEYVSGY